jgi:hypothetical protein
MKTKSIALSLFLVTMTVISGYAQGFHIGLKGGANIFKLDGRSFNDEFKFGYSLGGFAELNFNKSWGIQPELLWSQTNFRTASNFNSVVPGGYNDVKGSLNYLNIPILISYSPIKLISIQAGPQFGILLGQTNIVSSAKDAFKKGDFSLLGGAQLNLGGFKLGARYFIGLNNLNDVRDDDKWKNQGFQVYVGFRII